MLKKPAKSSKVHGRFVVQTRTVKCLANAPHYPNKTRLALSPDRWNDII